MKVLVAYYSETGNTRKVANVIYEEASKKHEAYLKKLNEVTPENLSDYDQVFLGSACHSSDLATPAEGFLEALSRSPRFKLEGFFTHSVPSPEDYPYVRPYFNEWAGRCLSSLEKASRKKGIGLIGCFNCQGVPSPPVQEFVHSVIVKSDDIWETYMAEARKHPSPEDLRKAKEFTRDVLSGL